MKSMITMLLLASVLLARLPQFNAMYGVTFGMYEDWGHMLHYRGEGDLWISEGYDSTTGQYYDFFAGDSGKYQFAIETSILEQDMENSYLDYAFQTRGDSESLIHLQESRGSWRVVSSTYDTILEKGVQVRPYYSYLYWRSDTMIALGDTLEYTESYDMPWLTDLDPNYRKNFLIIIDIRQSFEPTVQVVRVPAKRVVEAEAYRPLVDLLGRGSKLLLPGIFVSPHAPVLRIRRGP